MTTVARLALYDYSVHMPVRVLSYWGLDFYIFLARIIVLSPIFITSRAGQVLPYSDASLAPSDALLAPHFKSIFQLAVAYIGVLHKKL